jgi:hypothetical protein
MGETGTADGFGVIKQWHVLVKPELSDPTLSKRIPGAEAASWSIVIVGTRIGLVLSGAARPIIIECGPVAAPFRRWLSADEAKLHPTGASDVIAAIEQLDSPSALLRGTKLEVSTSLEALESCVIGVGGAHWHKFVGRRMCKAVDVGFAGATREVVALPASHDEFAVVGEGIKRGPNSCSEKGVAANFSRLALTLSVGWLNCLATWPRAEDPVGSRSTAVFPLFLVIEAEELSCEDAFLGISADVKRVFAPFGRIIVFVVEGSLEDFSYAVVADTGVVGRSHVSERRCPPTNRALVGIVVHVERVYVA